MANLIACENHAVSYLKKDMIVVNWFLLPTKNMLQTCSCMAVNISVGYL